MNISAAQCRAARGLLQWSQPYLAERSGISYRTISKFESETTATLARKTNNRIIAAFELAGVAFGGEDSVKLVSRVVTVLEGEDANSQLLDDIYGVLKEAGGEVLIFGLQEPLPGTEIYKQVEDHLARLNKKKITERVLLGEGDQNFIAPKHYYRWMVKENFIPVRYMVYADNIAFVDDHNDYHVTIMRNPLIAESLRGIFNFIWDRAIIPPVQNEAR